MNSGAAEPASRPCATLSRDLDNLWCYQRSFGLEAWRDYPSFLELLLPRVLDFLDCLELKATFFVIGRDAFNPANRSLLSEIALRGHEVGNHSFDHELALHAKLRGFRGPAFGLSSDLLEVLVALGYDYDASTCPNSLGLAARLWHRTKASKIGSAENVTGSLYGSLKDAGQSLKPYLWSLNHGALMEMPVTTLPLLRLPFHGTYLNYLADFSPALGDRADLSGMLATSSLNSPLAERLRQTKKHVRDQSLTCERA